MNRRVLNVDNGPGSNGLRGGIKQYSQKVTTGPWLDTYGGPMGYRRGFTCPDFQTEAQHAQLGVTLKPPGEFGAEIPAVETMDAKGNALNASYGTENWVSNTKATHPNFGVIKKEDTTYKLLQPRLSREKLLEYRRQWTCDKEANRKIRFQTESRIAGNAVGGKFVTNTLRALPGTPKSMEEYRRRLVERYGIFALSAVRLAIGTQGMSCKEFRARIQSIGVDIKPYELSQIIAYITPSSTDIEDKEIEGFLLLVKGRTEGFSAQAVTSVFFTLCNSSVEGVTLPMGSLLCAVDSDSNPEVLEGYAKFLPAYIGEQAEEVSVHQFVEMHDDMYASSPLAYEEMMDSVWKM